MLNPLDLSRLLAHARTARASAWRSSLCRNAWSANVRSRTWRPKSTTIRHISSSVTPLGEEDDGPAGQIDVHRYDHLDPQPRDYSSTPFIDSCSLTLISGAGGHGCAAFLKEKYISNGPPNGGDGGTGGNIYIQAVKGETSLHKLARRRVLRAGRGKNGKGGLQGGKRGDDVLIVVPVGTVVREINRRDPVAEELEAAQGRRPNSSRKLDRTITFSDISDDPASSHDWKKHWLLYPGTLPSTFTAGHIPKPPRPRLSSLAVTAPPAPFRLDLNRPMSSPLLLAVGAMGGLGNPHFVTNTVPRPKYATKGHEGVTIDVQLELKLLADVGLVGLPNAGKSTLLRALTASRARVGNWAFTTLAPNVGTVVLDSSSGPATQVRHLRDGITHELRTHFSIADIPGLIQGAHLDKGLGLDFLRHIERARALAFVVDLSAGDAVKALKGLWTELHQYELLRDTSIDEPRHDGEGSYTPTVPTGSGARLPPLKLPHISSKPWLVIATKADLDGTRDNFSSLRQYLADVESGVEPHPSGKRNAWTASLTAIPVCAKDKQNTEAVLDSLIEILSRPA